MCSSFATVRSPHRKQTSWRWTSDDSRVAFARSVSAVKDLQQNSISLDRD